MGVILSTENCETWCRRLQNDDKAIVFTNGCFDLLHPGHVRLLERARSYGNALLVAINSDRSVSSLKGPNRPIQSQQHRATIIASLEAVDAVTIFDDDTPCPLLERMLPDVLVKGADWSHDIVGRDIVEQAGGRAFALPFEEGYSTTDILRVILEHAP